MSIMQKQYGTILDIPDAPRGTCQTITTAMIRGRLAAEAKGYRTAEPGVCRFCKHVFAAQFIKVPFGSSEIEYPLLQCDRVARMYDQMDTERRQAFEDAEAQRKAGHAATTRKSDF